MSSWQAIFKQSGALYEQPQMLSFGEHPTDYPGLLGMATVTPLVHLGLVSIEGPDAGRFLQGQLTCHVPKLNVGDSQPGACCNAKGRMLSNFILYRTEEQRYLLQMHHSLVKPTLEHLAKYAVFFKAQLTDASDQYLPLGLSPAGDHSLPTAIDIYTAHSLSDGRKILLVEQGAQTAWQALANLAKPTGTEFWQLQDIAAGLGYVQLETAEMFIPQMLNLQAIDAISFRKGCYTGQEVVARMKYLGKLKRHMYRIAIPAGNQLLTPGTACYLPGTEQSVGNLVQAARCAENIDLLVVLTDEAASSHQLLLGSAHATEITHLDTPYSID
ncbi:CAF17-like 4Fe-4S cluster assembly/insertion protein YgfZ [Porticoccus sp.]